MAEKILSAMDGNSCSLCRCLGYAFVPVQQLGEVYPASDALENGSLFPELVYTINEYGKICKTGAYGGVYDE